MKNENNTDTLDPIVTELVATFSPGDLIPHAWLRDRFGIRDKRALKFRDYENEAAYLCAVDRLENQYSAQVRGLLDRLLEARKGWLVNRPGEGYMILPYDEHVTRAYNKFVEKLESSIRRTDRLIAYRPPVSDEQQARDNDRLARYSWFLLMVPRLKE